MAKTHNPRRGSMGFYPRKRARSQVPHVRSWPQADGEPRLQGFAGYKAGMTHALVVDYRPNSTTSGQEVMMPVTILEAPPMQIVAVRAYESTAYGKRTLTEVWADNVPERLGKRLPLPKKQDLDAKWKLMDETDVVEVRVLAITKPQDVTGTSSKTPELMEINVAGSDAKAQIEYAKGILGKELTVEDVMKNGQMMDAIGITKAYGFESRVVRFGTNLLSHKNSKHRRMIGTQGSWNPHWVQSTVPNDGQRGYHHRTEYNKRILKIGADGAEITPEGGFPHYGVVRNSYVMVHGSLPGPQKRLIRMRDATRYSKGVQVQEADIRYVSTRSKQGS